MGRKPSSSSNDTLKVSPCYTPTTPEEIAEIKIGILYDFCCLKTTVKRKHNGKTEIIPDPREEAIRKLLISKKTECAMQAAIHDVILGNKKI